MPSMPMFTTPERSFMKPHSAPSMIGTAAAMIVGASTGSWTMTYTTNWMTMPMTGMSYRNSTAVYLVACSP